jgi:single-stranded-DNA-specific exonuclease
MKKYIEKKLTDYPILDGFSKLESIIFIENGFNSAIDVYNNFPDLYTKSWLSKFLSSELSTIGGSKIFKDFIAINKDKKYCIIGDYDADGIMATTIMKIALDGFGVKDCKFIIPDRLNDGYGIKEKHVDKAIELGSDVIITVDNGVTAVNVIKYAKSKGLKVIITDHHIPDKDNLPEADIIINPHLTEEKFEHICGAMVALKLALVLLNVKDKAYEYLLKDSALFAAVATVSDVMPLIGENRSLLKYVLDNVNYYKNRNIWSGRTLKFLSGFGVGKYILSDPNIYVTEDTFGFYVGPTINASGRVNGETEGIITDIIEAGEYGKYINGYREINRERQQKTREIFKEHIPNPDEAVGFMVIDPDKYEYPIGGLIGLVATRISDKEQKPAFVGTEKDGKISFSCRSVPGYSLYDGLNRFMKKYPNSTVDGGGHDGAIGIRTSSQEEIQLLKEHFNEDFKENSKEFEVPVFLYDPNFESEIFDAHYALAPYGQGFRKLMFQYKGKVTKYIPETKEFFVDRLRFRTFIFEDSLPAIGSNVRVIFSPMTDSDITNSFKIEELDVISE